MEKIFLCVLFNPLFIILYYLFNPDGIISQLLRERFIPLAMIETLNWGSRLNPSVQYIASMMLEGFQVVAQLGPYGAETR